MTTTASAQATAQKITPFLWFDDRAEEASKFYVSLFENSKVGTVMRYGEAGPLPKGSVMTVDFLIDGQEFTALNGGPHFSFTPAISLFVNCKSEQEIDRLWNKLSEGGKVLMELDKYPFSEKFGWLEDRFGVSWQLSLGSRTQKITPFLMFVGEHGNAEKAISYYTSLLPNSSIINIERYGAGEGQLEGAVKHAKFTLSGQEFMAIDGGPEHAFGFTPAISFLIRCDTQEEVDLLWEKLSDGGEKERCGWLKDKFGLSWQIVPTILLEMLQDEDAAKSERVMNAVLQMDKIDIEGLKHAYEQ